jgi:hypothetical protein
MSVSLLRSLCIYLGTMNTSVLSASSGLIYKALRHFLTSLKPNVDHPEVESHGRQFVIYPIQSLSRFPPGN